MPKLTKTVVESAAPREKQYTVWCSDLTGFGVYVHPTGRRAYFVDYRNADGVRRRMTLGPHGKVTTEEARKLALAALGGAVRGEDPAAERATRRKSVTVSELCDAYMAAAEKGLIFGKGGRRKKESTLYVDRGRIERHIKPLLGRRLVIDIQRSDIVRFLRDVTAGKTASNQKTDKKRGRAIVEGGAGTASRTTGLLGGIFTFAASEGIRPDNPVHGVKRPADNRRQRRLSADEYKALGKALKAQAEEKAPPQAIAGVWLLALTGCRLGEVQKLRWSEVDIKGAALRLGDTKTGQSVRPLGSAAVEVLKALRPTSGNPFVLAGARTEAGYFTSLPAFLGRVTTKGGLADVTAHTLRHSFASVADDLGFTEATTGAIIGHSGSTITSRYIHKLDSVLVAAADRIAAEIFRQMTS